MLPGMLLRGGAAAAARVVTPEAAAEPALPAAVMAEPPPAPPAPPRPEPELPGAEPAAGQRVAAIPFITLSADSFETLAVMERRYILAALDHAGGDVPRAAAMLGVNPSTVYRKLTAWRAEGVLP